MARFSDVVGYATQIETAPGIWTDLVVEKRFTGDVIRNTRKMRDGESVNNDISVQNSISIVADAYVSENFLAIKYVKWSGVYWTVTDVEVQRPRLILRLGGVYNGPRPAPSGP